MRQLKWIKFAWKNVWRNRRRSLVTAGITATGVCGLLFFGGFVLFTYESLEEMAARAQGHVVMAHVDYFDKEEETAMSFGLDKWRTIRSDLKQDPRVRVVLPRIQFSGLISNGDKSTIYVATGVDPRREFTITGPFMPVSAGEVLTPEPKAIPGVMLAVGLARNLKSGVGSVLTLLTTTSEGSLNGLDVQVTGIFGTGVPEMDKRKLIVDLSTAQALLLTERVSTLSAYLYETSDTQTYEEEINKRYPILATRNWSDLAFFYHKVRDLYGRIFTVVGLVILVVVLLSVANTMSMAVVERTREIGTMAALGTLPGQVLRNFIIEAIVIGTMGSLFGMMLAGGVTVFLEVYEVMMPPPPGMTTGYPLRVHFSAELYTWTVSMMILITVLGAYFAARRGVKRPIVEALGHV